MSVETTAKEVAVMVNDGSLVTCSGPCYGGATVDVDELASSLHRFRLVWAETGDPIDTYDLTDRAGAGVAHERECVRWGVAPDEIRVEQLTYVWEEVK